MLKQIQKNEQAVGQPANTEQSQRHVLIQLFSDDFVRNDDGTWTTTKEIVITGTTENQRMIKEGKEFKKGDLSIVGLDLAAILEQHCPKYPLLPPSTMHLE